MQKEHAPFHLQELPDAGAHERERRLQWDPRLAVTQAGLPARGPILALRRQLASLAGVPDDAGAAWLQHAKLSRAAGVSVFCCAVCSRVACRHKSTPAGPVDCDAVMSHRDFRASACKRSTLF